jgi:hypothetical protein
VDPLDIRCSEALEIPALYDMSLPRAKEHNMTVADIIQLILSYRYSFSQEDGLQSGIDEALTTAGIQFVREHKMGAAGRIDFYLPALRCGIELKAGRSGGGPSKVCGQLVGYAEHPDIDELIVVSTRASLRSLPVTLRGKPLHAVILWANGL